MAMNNVPPQEPTPEMDMQAAAQAQESADVAADAAVADEQAAQVDEQAAAEQDAQVIDAVAEGLADEEITAEDIMTAVLSDSLGISPAGAKSLFSLLMSELTDDIDEASEADEVMDSEPME